MVILYFKINKNCILYLIFKIITKECYSNFQDCITLIEAMILWYRKWFIKKGFVLLCIYRINFTILSSKLIKNL